MDRRFGYANVLFALVLLIAAFAIPACKSDKTEKSDKASEAAKATPSEPDRDILAREMPGDQWFCQKSAFRICARSLEDCGGEECEQVSKAFCFTFHANGSDQANCFATERACKDVQADAGSHGAKEISRCGAAAK